jgi:hypothetical protein
MTGVGDHSWSFGLPAQYQRLEGGGMYLTIDIDCEALGFNGASGVSCEIVCWILPGSRSAGDGEQRGRMGGLRIV